MSNIYFYAKITKKNNISYYRDILFAYLCGKIMII